MDLSRVHKGLTKLIDFYEEMAGDVVKVVPEKRSGNYQEWNISV